jgi:hypothetical protein
LACLVFVLVAGCLDAGADENRAKQLVDAYFRAVAGGIEDRGWSLIHPRTRQELFRNDASAYVNAVRETDWTGFEWQFEEVREDDPGLFMVTIRFGASGIPAFLADPTPGPETLGGTLQDGTWMILVRFSADGAGILH